MTIKTKAFDASKYIDTPEAQAELIADALGTGDARYISAALGVVARARGMSSLATATGISRGALYAALSEDGNPTLDTILKVTKALGVGLTATVVANDHGSQAIVAASALAPGAKG